MLNFSKAILTFVIWSSIALTFHYFVSNKIFHNCFPENENALLISTKIEPLKMVVTSTNNDTIFAFNQKITIIKNTDSVFVSSENYNFTDSINNYLLNNYDKNILISGFYSTTENLKNLGIKRAEFVKNILNASTINPHRIETAQIENFEIFKKNKTAINAIKFEFKNRNQQEIDSLETAISNKTLHINFTDDYKIIDSLQLNKYIPYLRRYFEKYNESEIIITGHTDNDGFYQNNVIKGLNWANATRDYLIKKGLNSTKIKATSKGESEPIANKYTEEGKAKNRRIEIKIIK